MKESFLDNRKGICLMLVSSVCACSGQLLWKLSATYGFYVMALGFLLYGIGAMAMLYAYRYGKLSVLQPILSVNYILSLMLGAAVLHETVTVAKCVGIATIISGIVLIARSDS